MLQRQAKLPPLSIHIQRNVVGEKINRTIARWNADLDKLNKDSRMKKSYWEGWPSWEIVLAIVIIGALTTGLMWAGKKLWAKWTKPLSKASSYIQVCQGPYKNSSGTGLAAIEDLSEREEILPSQTGQTWFEVDPWVPVDSQNMVHVVQLTSI